MDGDTKHIFGIDESSVDKKAKYGRGRGHCAVKCVKCLLLLLLVLIVVLSVAAIVFVGVYYKFDFDRTNAALENRIAELEEMLNQTQPATSVDSLQQAMKLTNDLMDEVKTLNGTVNKLQSRLGQATADITEKINVVNDSLIDTQVWVGQATADITDKINVVNDSLIDTQVWVGLTTANITDKINVVNESLVDTQDRVDQTTADMALNLDQVSQNQRAVYVRWGSTSCPIVNGTTMVYSGVAGGATINHQGGGANHLCMPLDPEYTLPVQAGVQGFSAIFPVEYETGFLGSSNRNIPCAVCSVSTRTQALMIPAKTSCPAGWTREYFGYLLAEGFLNRRSTFMCTDVSHEGAPNAGGNTEANDMWQVEAQCSVLTCPPYVAENEIQCVVCSR